jgi:hypothetical protein
MAVLDGASRGDRDATSEKVISKIEGPVLVDEAGGRWTKQ